MSTYVTENEAKKAICPESLSRIANGSPCLGRICMAWRTTWEHGDAPASLKPAGEGWMTDGAPKGTGGAVTNRQKWKRQVGYCGKAGRPEDE